ncbi:MAG: flagellar accessory protein FlaH [Methanomethylovorans sp. PtaU1.Bin073]|nr:MAG: flagellar accessory protein FlaH [Methanomethylovorans sp. PtaU1.Bin073]
MLGTSKSAEMQQNITEEDASNTYKDAHSLYDTIRESIPQGNKSVAENIAAPSISNTGISVLDRSIGGGLPCGSMIYVSADPSGMAEIFLYQFTQSRKTYYFTTGRRPKYVLRDILNLNFDIKNIIFIDVYSEYYLTPSGEMVDNVGNDYADTKLLEFVEYNLKNIRNEAQEGDINLVFDNFSFFMNLNVNPGLLRRMMNLIYEVTKETSALTYLYGLQGSHPEKIENEILNSADVIFEISLDRGADKLVNKLAIPKMRGMLPTPEVIKFKICEGVQIDTSKDIA